MQIVGVRGLCPPILKLKRLPVVISNGRGSGNAGVNADIGVSLSTGKCNIPIEVIHFIAMHLQSKFKHCESSLTLMKWTN